MKWLNEQIEWLKGFFSEPSGKGSSKRLISFLVVIFFLVAYFKTTMKTETIVDIPDMWAFLISGIIGLGILDKYVQIKSKDNGGNSQNP